MPQITMLDLSLIVPGENDRTRFDAVKMQELADSIKANGLAQPITVRPVPETDLFRVVAGERRFRACQLAGLVEIPAIVRDDLTDEQAAAIMLTENLGRSDLDPIDEAHAYARRMQDFGYTVDQLAEMCGVSSVRIQFAVKLLKLRPELQDLVRSGNLTKGYAQVIADAELDSNFQMTALATLRENPHPTPQWFRSVCGELLTKQAQADLFTDPLFSGIPESAPLPKSTIEPPSPSTTKPPREGKNMKEIVTRQIAFWDAAAEQWAALGKPFKKQECQAAVHALQAILP